MPQNTTHKRDAGEFLCRSGYNYLDKMNMVFQLDRDDNSFLAKYIQLSDLKNKKLKETVTIIYTLKLQHCFESREIFLPLLLNDQLQTLETYVSNDPKLQTDYVEFLDSLCKMKTADIENMVL